MLGRAAFLEIFQHPWSTVFHFVFFDFDCSCSNSAGFDHRFSFLSSPFRNSEREGTRIPPAVFYTHCAAWLERDETELKNGSVTSSKRGRSVEVVPCSRKADREKEKGTLFCTAQLWDQWMSEDEAEKYYGSLPVSLGECSVVFENVVLPSAQCCFAFWILPSIARRDSPTRFRDGCGTR